MGRVSIVRTDQGIREGLVQAMDLIGGLPKYISAGDKVLLKPNLNGADVYTNKELVGALIEMLRDLGAGRVFIAESTFGNARITSSFFEKTGYRDLAARYGVDLVNLNESEAVDVPVANPLVLDKLHIAKEVFEADKIINIPSPKVHYATGVSLAMKNLKGFLVGDEKKHFHEIGLDKAIVDLNNTLRVDLNIIDAISCMERMGPHGGDVVNLNLVIAGGSRAEVDHVGCRVMGYDISEVKHLEQYVEMNGIDVDAVEVVGERVEDVAYPFKKVVVEGLIPEEFTVHDTNACCVCMNALLISCHFLNGKPTQPVDIHLGSLTEEGAVSSGLSVAFGNCCIKRMKADKAIRGCPPYPFTLGESLKDVLETETA
jgi:uncharacterized protein (DUF362 family)